MNIAQARAVFFDFDGVLVESNDVKIDAFRTLYKDYGDTVIEKVVAEHVRHEGLSRVVKIKRFHKEFLDIDLSDAALKALAQHFSGLVEDAVVACPPVPGAPDLVAALKRRGTPIYVVSGTPEDELIRINVARGSDSDFKGLFGSPRLKAHIVEEVLEDLGLHSSEAVFIGDSLTDMDAAETVGTGFIGRVPAWRENTFRPHQRVVEDMTALLDDFKDPVLTPA